VRKEYRVTPDAKPRLVVIEDNPADVQLLRFTLEDAGMACELLVIEDGLQGLNWVQLHTDGQGASRPDITVLDLNLPRHDGIEILEAMQRTPELASVPVLVLSSSPSPRDIARVTAFPNTRYLTKPAVLEEYSAVAAVVRQMLDERSHKSASGAR
jgi:CheY-like chemotaxis protein